MTSEMTDEDLMRLAIDQAREGIEAGQSPFGAVIARNGRPVAVAHNVVWLIGDPTAHAEVCAIRLAARELKSIDLSGCEIFSTCEPCPMCLAAVHWSKISRLVYGAGIADAVDAGFSELRFPARELAERGGSAVQIAGGVLAPECRGLFRLWSACGKSRAY
jgi:guanine deaminase